jgi:hypothetical protein
MQAFLAALLFVGAAWAHGGDDSESKWYRSLIVPGTARMSCCDAADCSPTRYRIVQAGYEVPTADGKGWEAVPPDAVIHRDNPTGEAVVCRYGGGIRCFVPNGEG